MHMSLMKLVVLALVAGAVAIAVIQPPFAVDLYYTVKGYKKAATPEDAMDSFNKAMDKRDYHAAVRYLGGEDYPVKFRKIADKAEKLTKAIDDFRSVMESQSIKSEKIEKELLCPMEPFPRKLTVRDLKKSNDETATAAVTVEGSTSYGLFDPKGRVDLKKEGEQWKLILPLTTRERAIFENIEKYSDDLTNALNVVKTRMKTDATTKENVYNDLKDEVEKAMKPG